MTAPHSPQFFHGHGFWLSDTLEPLLMALHSAAAAVIFLKEQRLTQKSPASVTGLLGKAPHMNPVFGR